MSMHTMEENSEPYMNRLSKLMSALKSYQGTQAKRTTGNTGST